MENARTTYVYGKEYLNHDLESINNMQDVESTQYRMKKRIYGFYGDLRFSYKEIFYFGATARNDHSSTLPKNNNSLFYPSVNAGVNIVNLIWNGSNSIFSYGKLRASWAQVGKDAPPQKLTAVLESIQTINGGFKYDYYAGNPYLKP